MAKKKHWAVSTDDPTAGRKFRLACGMWAWINSAKDSGPLWSLCSAAVYRDLAAACDPDWYCVTCTKAARLALAKEQPIAVSFSPTVRRCTRCRSGAINPSDHGRTEGVDLDLCDVCYWRKRESAPKVDTRTDSDRYAELRQLVEDCQREAMDPASPLVVFDNALRLVLDWRHR